MMRFGVLVVLAGVLAGCSREEPVAAERSPLTDERVFEPTRIASAYMALMEKPDAVRVLLVGDEARRLAPYFTRAGVKAETAKKGRFDLVVVACAEMTKTSCARAAELLSENGVLVWLMNVRDVTVGDFQRQVNAFDLPECHLWMPGESRWLLVGRRLPRRIKLSSMLDVFARETAFGDLAAAACSTVPELFANYAGTRADLLPAFEEADVHVMVRPEFFLTREIPVMAWLSDEGVDADIAEALRVEIRSLQVIRRLVVEGNMLAAQAKDAQSMKDAVDRWSRAALRNPNDLFLLDRLDRMDRNAREFMQVGRILDALKCYETVSLIRPTAARVHNFGVCLQKLGKTDLAERAFARAKELEK